MISQAMIAAGSRQQFKALSAVGHATVHFTRDAAGPFFSHAFRRRFSTQPPLIRVMLQHAHEPGADALRAMLHRGATAFTDAKGGGS